MRVFYFNITYRCNSNCMFCAADHPIYNEQTEMTLEEIAKILRDNHVGSGDRVIVNGGEPTIHRSFWEILDTIDRLGAKIDLFTNGQKLADEQFAKRLTAYRDIYIRVPLFGATAQVHDYLTGCRGGFDRVVKGLDHVYRYLGKGSQLEIKLLMSRVSVEENEKIYDLVKTRWPGPHVILSLNPLLISKCVIEHKDLFIEEYWKIFSQNGYEAKTMLGQYFPYIHEQGGDSGYFGRCVCSKYKITNYIVNTFANDSNRYYDQCEININNQTVHLVITHLGTSISARTPQITALLSKLSGFDHFILAGDMNTPYNADPDTDAEIERFSDEGYVLSNCGEFGKIATDPGIGSTSGWIGWLDNIITSSDIEITDAYDDQTKITLYNQGLVERIDHLPLLAEISI